VHGRARTDAARSDDAVVATFDETIEASSLPTVFEQRIFSLSAPYVIQSGDRIMVQYNGPNGVQMPFWSTDQVDGLNTRRTRYDGTSYVGGSTQDIAGTMSS